MGVAFGWESDVGDKLNMPARNNWCVAALFAAGLFFGVAGALWASALFDPVRASGVYSEYGYWWADFGIFRVDYGLNQVSCQIYRSELLPIWVGAPVFVGAAELSEPLYILRVATTSRERSVMLNLPGRQESPTIYEEYRAIILPRSKGDLQRTISNHRTKEHWLINPQGRIFTGEFQGNRFLDDISAIQKRPLGAIQDLFDCGIELQASLTISSDRSGQSENRIAGDDDFAATLGRIRGWISRVINLAVRRKYDLVRIDQHKEGGRSGAIGQQQQNKNGGNYRTVGSSGIFENFSMYHDWRLVKKTKNRTKPRTRATEKEKR